MANLVTMLQTKLRKGKKKQVGGKKTNKPKVINASMIVKRANYYFDKNPTYIKETEVGEVVHMNLKRYIENNGIKANGTGRIPQFGYPHLKYEDEVNSNAKTVKNQSINRYLIGTMPKTNRVTFGDSSPVVSKTYQYSLQDKIIPDIDEIEILPFKEALDQKRRQDRIMDHVHKCFTFGKKVRRQMDDDPAMVSRVELLKRRFKRLDLLRDFFSVKQRKQFRKFKYPINELALELNSKPLEIYDELQYCQESDIEDIKSKQKKKKTATIDDDYEKQQNQIDKILKVVAEERHQSLDLKKQSQQQGSRLDLSIIQSLASNIAKNIPQMLLEQKPEEKQVKKQKGNSDSEDTFRDLDSDNFESIYSSPRQMKESETLAYDKVMPFDFITQRKLKKFYNQEQLDLDILLQSKEKALKLISNFEHKKDYQEDLQPSNHQNKYEFPEDDLNELPEINKQSKIHNKVEARKKIKNKMKNKKLVIKGELSSSSDDERFKRYNFAQKVQNTQIRDQNNDLLGLFFQRSQAKNQKVKKQMLMRIAEFKRGISQDQKDALQNRQFVIVDVKSLNQNKLTFIQKRHEHKAQEEQEKEDQKKKNEYIQERSSKLQQLAKNIIMREKSLFTSRNNSIQKSNSELVIDKNATNLSSDNEGTHYQYQNQMQILNRNLFTGVTSTVSSITNLGKMRPATSGAVNHNSNIYNQNQLSFNTNDPKQIYSNNNTHQASQITQSVNTQRVFNNRLMSGRIIGQSVALQHLKNQVFLEYQNTETTLGLSNRVQDNDENINENGIDNGNSQSVILLGSPENMGSRNENLQRIDLMQSQYSNGSIHHQSNNNLRYDYTQQSAKVALKLSPYEQIENEIQESYQRKNRTQSAHLKSKIRGYLAEKLRRKSVLNCDLFKTSQSNYKSRITDMVDKLNSVLGTSINKNKDKD